jgi:quercetin dioxygenase-like cupin family protein
MQRSQHQPLMVDISIYAGIYVKTFVVPDRGTLVPQHSHHWPHISYLVSGVMRVWCGEQQLGDFAAPCAVRIAAHEKHSFLTLTDNVTILCIHNADHLDAAEEPDVAEMHTLQLED